MLEVRKTSTPKATSTRRQFSRGTAAEWDDSFSAKKTPKFDFYLFVPLRVWGRNLTKEPYQNYAKNFPKNPAGFRTYVIIFSRGKGTAATMQKTF